MPRLQAAGVNVGIGTDGVAGNNLDMSRAQKRCAACQRHERGPTQVSAETALEMGTINGARLMGLQDKIGSLGVGKQADVIAIDLSDPLPTCTPSGFTNRLQQQRRAGEPRMDQRRAKAQDKQFVDLDITSVLAKPKAGGKMETPVTDSDLTNSANVDGEEINKFNELARKWWDPNGEFKTLHDINPLRVDYIASRANINGAEC